MNEFALIDACFKRLGDQSGALLCAQQPVLEPTLGIGDDCALLSVPAGMQLVVSTDTLVAGVHFPLGTRAFDIGHKALAVNLSDLAAMGATPAWFTLCVTLPQLEEEWVNAFCAGLLEVMQPHPIALVGGDTTRGPLSISVQVMGLVPAGQALTRSGAQVGDDIYVSGTIGEAAVGLALALDAAAPQWQQPLDHHHYLDRLNRPTPRVRLGHALRGIAHACIDVSDGLLADLQHVLQGSGVGARLERTLLPLTAGLDAEAALTAGDDYELCFTAPAAAREDVAALAQQLGLPLTRIGRVTQEAGIRDHDQQPMRAAGYQHF